MATDLDLLLHLTKENKRLQKQVDELQKRCTELKNEVRVTDRRQMVREFFVIADQPRPETITTQDEQSIRLGFRLIIEEFIELLEAIYGKEWTGRIVSELSIIDHRKLYIDLPAVADALVDLGYVTEGLFIRLGINATPLWAEVHRTNMLKVGGPKRVSDGKLLRPEGWTPPLIKKLLREQGYK
jgi:predicted HAD superfamily Cof-like phosphohydrolase